MIKTEQNMAAITSRLESANDYLEAEKVIVDNLKAQFDAGVAMSTLDENLLKLNAHINTISSKSASPVSMVNYNYAKACLNTLISVPFWHGWIRTLKAS